MESTSSFSQQDGGVVHKDADRADLLNHCSTRSIDALNARDVHRDDHRPLLLGPGQAAARSLESALISPGEDNGQALRQQLTARLESESAIRAGHERDRWFVMAHTTILTVG
jgi:hypothetical protein